VDELLFGPARQPSDEAIFIGPINALFLQFQSSSGTHGRLDTGFRQSALQTFRRCGPYAFFAHRKYNIQSTEALGSPICAVISHRFFAPEAETPKMNYKTISFSFPPPCCVVRSTQTEKKEDCWQV